MDEEIKEINAHINFFLSRLASEYPTLSRDLTRELRGRKGMTDQDKKINKLGVLRSKHPVVWEELLAEWKRKFGIEEKSGYKADAFFSSPYIMSRVNSDPLDFPGNK